MADLEIQTLHSKSKAQNFASQVSSKTLSKSEEKKEVIFFYIFVTWAQRKSLQRLNLAEFDFCYIFLAVTLAYTWQHVSNDERFQYLYLYSITILVFWEKGYTLNSMHNYLNNYLISI